MSLHEHHHSHGHSHDIDNISGKKLFWVTMLNALITLAEIVGGVISGSLALLSDAIHNLSDTLAIAISYFALKISKKERNQKKTFGYRRAQVIAAFINSSALVVISLFLIWESYKRILHPEEIKSTLMIIVALIGLFANLIAVWLLEKDAHKNMNIKASYLHLIGDTVSSVGVVLGGIAIKIWGITIVDPILTILISIYLMKEAWGMVKHSVDILMQASADMDYDALKKDIEAIDKVKNIHHVHTWYLDEKTIFFEAHLDIDDMPVSDTEPIYKAIEHILKEKYGVFHITLQFEADRCCDKKMF